jgi:hypothetical protein
MNKITGKITLTSSNTGIPNLLVVVYDIDPDARPEEIITGLASQSTRRSATRASSNPPRISPKNELGLLGDRIGSVLTGTDGAFLIEYEDAEYQIRNPRVKRPDLFLMVFAPEKMGTSLQDSLLFYSPEIRQDAGRIESYYIQISEDKLKEAGLQTIFDSGSLNVKSNFSTVQVIRNQTKAIAKELIEAENANQESIKKVVDKKAWSSFFKLEEKPNMKRASVSQIKEKYSDNIKNINKEIFEKENVRGKTFFVFVPADEIAALKAANPAKQSELLEKYIAKYDQIAVEGAVFRKEYNNPLSTTEKKEDLIGKLTSETQNELDIEEVIEQLINSIQETSLTAEEKAELINKLNSDIETSLNPDYVKRLIDPMKSPEELIQAIQTGTQFKADSKRPDGKTVNDNIKSLEFKGGPADVPAFYDFHSLQIAFPHVWQELIDNDIIQVTEDLLTQLVENGIDVSDITDADDLEEKLTEKVKKIEYVTKMNKTYSNSIAQPIGNGTYNADVSIRDSIGIYKASNSLEVMSNSEAGWLLKDLKDLLKEKSKFTTFKEGHINYGIMVTYRQKWTPLNYQVGDLVRSIPLSPKEVRKVNVKKVVKKDNTIKAMENNLRTSQEESNSTERTEKEIVNKAHKNNSFGLTASVNGSYGVGANDKSPVTWSVGGSVTTDIKRDASKSSESVKKNFRESVKKAAQEYKDERKLEIETKETFESEYIESAEISNPNDELTVTYLFYELQRRFEVSEKLHKVTPLVLVPMQMPTPSRKDMNALVLKHGWIISRVLLDDRFRPALEYLMSGLIGEEAAINELKENLKAIRANLSNLSTQLSISRSAFANFQAEYDKQTDDLDDSSGKKRIAKNQFQVEIAKEVMQDAKDREQVILDRIASENANLLTATNQLNQAKTALEAKLFEINMLRLHLKENIFYYMQTIWDYTYKDSIFMTLYDDKVPVIEAKKKKYKVVTFEPNEIPPSVTTLPNKKVIEVEVKYEMDIPLNSEMLTLAEIADLDSPLGYKGNYMIFPMKQSNAITEYMMTPFLDEELGLRDPDGWGQWTPDEFIEFFNHLKQTKSKEEFAEMRDALVVQYGRILDASRRLTEEIIVPSDSLYIEALPGKHPLLEDFKLMHRIMDVQKVQAEVRKMELENLRYANRILDKQLDDPDTEKKVIVEGDANTIINPEI